MCRFVEGCHEDGIVFDFLNLVCKVLVHKRCHKNVITSCGDKNRTQSLIVKADEVYMSYQLYFKIKIIFSSYLKEHSVLASMYHIDLRFTIIKHQLFATTVVLCCGES